MLKNTLNKTFSFTYFFNSIIHRFSTIMQIKKSLSIFVSAICLLITTSYPTIAEEKNQITHEIEQIKKEVLKLNRELFILEEDLLFPASTQVSVFVSVDIGRFFTLDSVELKINDEDVAGFLYTERQRYSLEQGGIQRLFKGNLKSGEHQLTAIFIGLDQEKRTVKRAVNYTFEKEDDAVMIELKLEDNTRKFQTEVVVEEWIL